MLQSCYRVENFALNFASIRFCDFCDLGKIVKLNLIFVKIKIMILKKADIYLSMIMDQQDKDLHIMSDRTL